MINATQLRTGMVIRLKDDFWRVSSVQHVTPGKGRGMMQTELRNLKSGSKYEHRFRSNDRVETATLEERKMEYLYESGDQYVFMDPESYEQENLNADIVGDALQYLVPNLQVKVQFLEGAVAGVELPITVDLKVVETEPTLKSATAADSPKPARLETGLMITVPKFIEEGEVVRVDSRTGKYLERVRA